MEFSVVISVYNKEKYIGDTLQSVLGQTYQNFEIIVLNDGSTDGSETEILQFDDPRIHYFSQENKGAGAARNEAISKAKYPYIALLDADDYWYPHYLEEQKKAMEAFPGHSVFTTAKERKEKGNITKEEYSVDSKEERLVVDFFKASQLNSILDSSSVVLHQRVFEKAGYYDPKIKSGQDTDFFVRIGLHFEVVFTQKICTQHIINETSLYRSTSSLSEKANFEAYEKFEANNPNLKKYLDLNRYSLALFAKLHNDREGFERNFNKIDPNNLSSKQLFVLKQPKEVIIVLLKTKDFLQKWGIRWGTFK